MHPRHPRRTLRYAIGGLLLAAPVLTSCGFDYATDRVNDITAGHTTRDADVDVVNSLIVAAHPDSGTLIGMLANNRDGADDDLELTSVTSGPDETEAEFEPLTVPPAGRAQLQDAGIRIEGTFEAGAVYDVTLTFGGADGEEIEVQLAVPVVTECGQYEGYDDAPGAGGASGEAYSCETEEAPEQSH